MIVAVINYGMGNTFSVKQTIEKMGYKVFIANHPNELQKVNKIILPGVGSFYKAMKNLNIDGWTEVLTKLVKKEKMYLAETKEDIDDKKLPALIRGMKLDQGEYAKGSIKRLDRYKGRILWEVILTEGKNREVKRIFETFGTHVISLHRYSFADLNVNSLKVGKYRQLNSKIIQSLF